MSHSFKRDCIEFWRDRLDDEVEELRSSRIRAVDLKALRRIIRDSGERTPTAAQFRREAGGQWLNALRSQIRNASRGQIEEYATEYWRAKYSADPFECPSCGYGM